jgi:hypothetical protein
MEQPAAQKPSVSVNIPAVVNSIYINSFAAGLSTGDVFVVMQRNGVDIGTLNMSYTVAKSLGDALNMLVSSLEKRSGRNIMTSNECAIALAKPDENMQLLK